MAGTTLKTLDSKHDYEDFSDFFSSTQRSYFSCDLQSSQTENFKGEIIDEDFGCAKITTAYFDPLYCVRDKKMVNEENDHIIVLTYYIKGGQSFSFKNGDIEISTRSKDILLWDNLTIGNVSSTEEVRNISLFVPRSIVHRHIPSIDSLLVNKSKMSGLSYILASHMNALRSSISSIPMDDVSSMLGATLELIGTCFQPDTYMSGRTAHKQAVMQRIRSFIYNNIIDIDIDSQCLSEEFGYSTRYVHKLFAESGTTLTAFVRNVRLDKAAHILSASGRRTESITKLAYDLGFCDTSHFSKSFKNRYGCSPRDFRKKIQ